jgi:hypothetical protein
MKIPLKTKVLAWYLHRGVIVTKDNLAKRNRHGNKMCVFCHQDMTIKNLFFRCKFARSICSAMNIGSTLYPSWSVANIFGNRINGVDPRFKLFIRMVAIAIIWSLWLCRNDKIFSEKLLLLCSHLYSVWSIATFLWRCLYGWRTMWGILLHYMDGNIIYGLVFHLHISSHSSAMISYREP